MRTMKSGALVLIRRECEKKEAPAQEEQLSKVLHVRWLEDLQRH